MKTSALLPITLFLIFGDLLNRPVSANEGEAHGKAHTVAGHEGAENAKSDHGPSTHEHEGNHTQEKNKSDTTASTSGSACAVLVAMGGGAEVMDTSRTKIVQIKRAAPLPCGSWVTTRAGWAKVRLRASGKELALGQNTVLEVASGEDALVLYHGEILVESRDGAEELRIITPNARIRIQQGKLIAIFDPQVNETQLVSLVGTGKIENRFQPERPIDVVAGRSSVLDFKLMRVVPGDPKPVSLNSVKGKLAQLQLPESEVADLVRHLISVQSVEREQGHDNEFTHSDPDGDSRVNRGLASDDGKHATKSPQVIRASKSRYDRAMSVSDRELLKKFWAERMLAGSVNGGSVIPAESAGKRVKRGRVKGRYSVNVEDRGGASAEQVRLKEEKDKKQLMEDLAKIRSVE